MKLGTQIGSLTNHLFSRMVKGQPKPIVGMGATILCWTDRHAATIIDVSRRGALGNTLIVTVQEDNAKRTDTRGMCESQDYDYTRNPNGRKTTFRSINGGIWQEIEWNEKTRRWNKNNGNSLRIGERDEYHDFSF